MQIGRVEVARAQALGRQFPRIGAAPGVRDLVAAAMRQRERGIAPTHGGELAAIRHWVRERVHGPVGIEAIGPGGLEDEIA
jgi:hypothetical protein